MCWSTLEPNNLFAKETHGFELKADAHYPEKVAWETNVTGSTITFEFVASRYVALSFVASQTRHQGDMMCWLDEDTAKEHTLTLPGYLARQRATVTVAVEMPFCTRGPHLLHCRATGESSLDPVDQSGNMVRFVGIETHD